MINTKILATKDEVTGRTFVSALRRDASFVWNAVIAVVFIGFASLAVAAAVLDVMAIRH